MLYKLWSEWDFGEKGVIFTSKKAGINWIKSLEAIHECAADDNSSVDDWVNECFYQGYFSWEEIELISEEQ